MGLQCELPPIRSLDDFLLSSARFQKPNFDDLDKWGNRVTKNFLYYQTNYIGMAALLWTVFIIFNAWQTILGLTAIGVICAAFVIINPSQAQGQPQYQQLTGATGWLSVVGIGAATYFVLYLFESVLFVLLIILLPFCLAFIHASFRLRNLKNKLSTSIDERLRYTPMGVFLETMTVGVEALVK